jgi:PAS domain-containing protein
VGRHGGKAFQPRNFLAAPSPKEWINRDQAHTLSPAAEGTPQGPLAFAPEQVFKLLIEGVSDYAIFMLDPEGHVASWNPGAERLKGYTRTEILGRHFSTFYTQ